MNAGSTTIDRIRRVIGTVCEVTPETISMNARLRGYGIDSVRVLELLMSIEEEFGIELKVDQMSQIGTVRDLVEHIDAQTAHGGYQLDRTATS